MWYGRAAVSTPQLLRTHHSVLPYGTPIRYLFLIFLKKISYTAKIL
jgi:hypothetical protein